MLISRRKIFTLVFALIAGGIGGILFDQILLPYSDRIPFLKNVDLISNLRERTIIVNKTEEKIIAEDQALGDAVSKVGSSVVLIKAYKDKKFVLEGTAFFITNDGLFVSSSDLASFNWTYKIITESGDLLAAQLKKTDLKKGLAIFSADKIQSKPINFSQEELKLGKKIILLGAESSVLSEQGKEKFAKFIDFGIINKIDNGVIATNLENKKGILGAFLINFNGEIIGLAGTDKNNQIIILTADKIKEFWDEYIKGFL